MQLFKAANHPQKFFKGIRGIRFLRIVTLCFPKLRFVSLRSFLRFIYASYFFTYAL